MIVEVEGLGKRYGAVEALRGVTFAVDKPGVVGILGPNGAGKTTLLDVLEGLARADAGTVRLFGAPLDVRHYPRRRVGVVLQREFAFDAITVAEYAALFAAIHGVRDGKARILDGARLADRARVALAQVSGGEAQRLFLAAATVHAPELLLLDEPTAHLDPPSKRDVGAAVRALGQDRAVLFTTHDLAEAETLCDRVLFLVDGQLRADGAPADLVAALPAGKRRGRGLEDVFFDVCAARITRRGDLESSAGERSEPGGRR